MTSLTVSIIKYFVIAALAVGSIFYVKSLFDEPPVHVDKSEHFRSLIHQLELDKLHLLEKIQDDSLVIVQAQERSDSLVAQENKIHIYYSRKIEGLKEMTNTYHVLLFDSLTMVR